MAAPVITHRKVSGKPQGTDPTRIYGNHWDDTHVITGLDFSSLSGAIAGAQISAATISNAMLVNSTLTLGSSTLTLGTTTPTISGLTLTSPTFSGTVAGSGTVPNSVLVNSAVTIGTTAVSLGGSSTTLAGLTSITGALHIGGTAAASTLELRATSGVGAGSEQVVITAGNNGAASVATFTSDSTGTFGRFGIRCTPTVTFEMAGLGNDAFVDQYRATMYVHATNGGGSAGLAFGNLGGPSVGTQTVIQNVINRTTGGVTTASALVTSAQDVGNTTFAADFAIQTSINATLGNRIYINKGGSVVMGAAAVATNATDGFAYIATCAGAPTGVPTAQTGHCPMVYDTTNHKFWMFDTGTNTWKGVVLT
jgi:hypothetical protein